MPLDERRKLYSCRQNYVMVDKIPTMPVYFHQHRKRLLKKGIFIPTRSHIHTSASVGLKIYVVNLVKCQHFIFKSFHILQDFFVCFIRFWTWLHVSCFYVHAQLALANSLFGIVQNPRKLPETIYLNHPSWCNLQGYHLANYRDHCGWSFAPDTTSYLSMLGSYSLALLSTHCL